MRVNVKIVLCLAGAAVLAVTCKRGNSPADEDPQKAADLLRLETVERNLPAAEDYTDTVFGIPLEMVYMEGGSFWMGADTTSTDIPVFGDEKPLHKAAVKSYYISRYEISQDLWTAVMGYNPSHFNTDGRLPVEQVSWLEANDFCFKLSLITGKSYTLPSELQWEYAAKGGSRGVKTFYSGSNYPEHVAVLNRNQPSLPGEKKPNEAGLYDMSGNVWEWCLDWYGLYKDEGDSIINTHGPAGGVYRIIRGGSWASETGNLRVSFRSGLCPEEKTSVLGFRVVRIITEPCSAPSRTSKTV